MPVRNESARPSRPNLEDETEFMQYADLTDELR